MNMRLAPYWVLKNWCFCIVVLEKTLQSPLDSKEIKPVNPKGNQPWIFIGTTEAEAEAPILRPPDMKSQSIGKDPDAGKNWGLEKGLIEDEMIEGEMRCGQKLPHLMFECVGWHHRLNGHKFEQTLDNSKGQRSLVCCSPWGCKELDMSWRLNNDKVYPGIKNYVITDSGSHSS